MMSFFNLYQTDSLQKVSYIIRQALIFHSKIYSKRLFGKYFFLNLTF